jgi:hypothetical protein
MRKASEISPDDIASAEVVVQTRTLHRILLTDGESIETVVAQTEHTVTRMVRGVEVAGQ